MFAYVSILRHYLAGTIDAKVSCYFVFIPSILLILTSSLTFI